MKMKIKREADLNELAENEAENYFDSCETELIDILKRMYLTGWRAGYFDCNAEMQRMIKEGKL